MFPWHRNEIARPLNGLGALDVKTISYGALLSGIVIGGIFGWFAGSTDCKRGLGDYKDETSDDPYLPHDPPARPRKARGAKFQTGDTARVSYRVPPFLTDEEVVIQAVVKGKHGEVRYKVLSERVGTGWLYETDLVAG